MPLAPCVKINGEMCQIGKLIRFFRHSTGCFQLLLFSTKQRFCLLLVDGGGHSKMEA